MDCTELQPHYPEYVAGSWEETQSGLQQTFILASLELKFNYIPLERRGGIPCGSWITRDTPDDEALASQGYLQGLSELLEKMNAAIKQECNKGMRPPPYSLLRTATDEEITAYRRALPEEAKPTKPDAKIKAIRYLAFDARF